MLTLAERRAANRARDWLRSWGGDSSAEPNCSPAGDGRWVRLDEIFPRRPSAPAANAMRQAVRRLHARGALVAYEIAYFGDCVKAVPAERVALVERAIAALSPQEREALAQDE